MRTSRSCLATRRLGLESLEDRCTPTAGLLDPTFGSGGKVFTDFLAQADDEAYSIALQPNDGKIVVAGYTQSATSGYDFAVARYNADGTIDTAFGPNQNGRVTIDFGPGSDVADDVTVQPDGNILVVGHTFNQDSGRNELAVVRLLANGARDTTFGPAADGLVTVNMGHNVAFAYRPLLQDGKIIVVSNFRGDWTGSALLRLNGDDGSVDNSFGTDGTGRVLADVGGNYGVADALLQADGRIVVAGVNTAFRLDKDGRQDPSFVAAPLDFSAFGIVADANGNILIAGRNEDGAPEDFVVARLDGADGSLDLTFGTGGEARIDFGSGHEIALGVAVQSDGRVVVLGWTEQLDGHYIAVTRLTTTGALDTSFGVGGRVLIDFARADDIAGYLRIQPDGGIVIPGSSFDPVTNHDFALARLIGSNDADGDGIDDFVDTLPATFSNDFSDGTTTGSIVSRGDQQVTIVNALDPTRGVVLTASPAGGAAPATVSVPGSTLTLSAGDQVIAMQGSVILDALVGTIEAAFVAAGGQQATASLPAGNRLTFEPTTGTFTAPASNPATVVVLAGGMEVPLTPGTTVLPVLVDIRPGTSPNTINLGSNGTVPVAILSTATFDATTVDPLSVTLAGAAVRLRGNGTPQTSQLDVNGDGRLDLVVHVTTEALELTAGDVQAVLKGETTGGLCIQGQDTVRVINGLHAETTGPNAQAAALTADEARAMVGYALDRWSAALGLESLPAVEVVVDDLPANLLGTAAGRVVTVDVNAAGWGWFVDPTPSDDSEFTTPGDQGEEGRMDLLTVLMHEMGHLLGLDHADEGVMHETLAAGVREGVAECPTAAIDQVFNHPADVPACAPIYWGDVLGLLSRKQG